MGGIVTSISIIIIISSTLHSSSIVVIIKLSDLDASDDTVSHRRQPPHKWSCRQHMCIRKWKVTTLRCQVKAMEWHCLLFILCCVWLWGTLHSVKQNAALKQGGFDLETKVIILSKVDIFLASMIFTNSYVPPVNISPKVDILSKDQFWPKNDFDPILQRHLFLDLQSIWASHFYICSSPTQHDTSKNGIHCIVCPIVQRQLHQWWWVGPYACPSSWLQGIGPGHPKPLRWS